MKRRDFITLLCGAAARWPLSASAQQPERMRRVGWLIAGAENDPQIPADRAAFQGELAKLGWVEGLNLQTVIRFGARDLNRIRIVAMELIGLAPDVIVTNGGAATLALQQRTQTLPIVFTGGGDPVDNGLVRNIARPEGNVTGFSTFEPSITGKWLELLKEAAPHLAKIAVIFNPDQLSSSLAASYITSIDAAAPALAVKVIQAPVRNAIEIVHAIDMFAAGPDGGLIVLPPPSTADVRENIQQLARQHRLPAIYPYRIDVEVGGLLAYSSDTADVYRRAAAYVDRLLRGAKVADLPVQFPTKYKLVVNVKTAKAIGLTIPEAFLLHADELIE